MVSKSSIDCNEDDVYYVEARIDSKIKSIIEFPQMELLDQFIPYSLNGDSIDYRRQLNNSVLWSLGERPVTKRFVLSAFAIDTLKSKLAEKDLSAIQTTCVEAVSALIWKCCIAAKELKHGTKSVAFHTVNVRGRVVPALPEATFELFRFSSWCRFPVYEADFGWGKPTWISIAGSPNKGCVIFMDSRYDEGIEVWLVLDEKAMEKFELDPEFQFYNSSSSNI
ncbi:hypothetical protein LguiA_012990 [Lonicera macranthoides]